MISFWILAAGLTALALLFVVPPLLNREVTAPDIDQDDLNLALFREQLADLERDLAAGNLDQAQYDAARHDLERELLADVDDRPAKASRSQGSRWVAILAALVVPAGAVTLYLQLGEAEIIPRLQATAARQTDNNAHAAGAARDRQSVEALVQKLATRMEQEPDDLQGWLMLGRSYFSLEQPERALRAFERAYGLAPEEPEVLLALAQALAAVNEGSLVGRPAELINQTLAIAPNNAGALWLSGMLNFQQGRYRAASDTWGQVLTQLDPDSEDAVELRQFIAEANHRAADEPQSAQDGPGGSRPMESGSDASVQAIPADPGDATSADASDGTGPSATTPAAPSIQVTVELAESLLSQVKTDDTLFVYAKAASGLPMPLAVKRSKVRDLPLTVTLDDSLAMVAGPRLSDTAEVIVGARISKSGQATPQVGDLEGEIGPIAVGENPSVQLTIDHARQ